MTALKFIRLRCIVTGSENQKFKYIEKNQLMVQLL